IGLLGEPRIDAVIDETLPLLVVDALGDRGNVERRPGAMKAQLGPGRDDAFGAGEEGDGAGRVAARAGIGVERAPLDEAAQHPRLADAPADAVEGDRADPR